MFRVYADKDNNPASYSPENVPYRPKQHLSISLKGVQKGDYTMIMGTTIFLASLIVIMNLISDLLYKAVDPRIEFD